MKDQEKSDMTDQELRAWSLLIAAVNHQNKPAKINDLIQKTLIIERYIYSGEKPPNTL